MHRLKSLVIVSVGTLSSGVRYAMLTRPNKTETGLSIVANIFSSMFFFGSYGVNSLYNCHLCVLSVAIIFPFTLLVHFKPHPISVFFSNTFQLCTSVGINTFRQKGNKKLFYTRIIYQAMHLFQRPVVIKIY